MRYTIINWKTGDVITAEQLNNLEAGVYSANNLKNGVGIEVTDTDDGKTVSFKLGNGLVVNEDDGTIEIGTSIAELADDVVNVSQRVTKVEDDLSLMKTLETLPEDADLSAVIGKVNDIIAILQGMGQKLMIGQVKSLLYLTKYTKKKGV